MIFLFPTADDLKLQLASVDKELESEMEETDEILDDFDTDPQSVIDELKIIIKIFDFDKRQRLCLEHVVDTLISEIYKGY